MAIPEINLDALSTAELTDLYDQVGVEVRRREALADAEQRIVDIQVEVLTASGREMGTPWVAPSGAHDAYPEGWEVTHDGKTWKSNHGANVWEPGSPEATNLGLWEDMTPPPEPDPETGHPEWVPGTDYLYGDNVMYEGVQYMVQIAHRSQTDWLPPNVPALYVRVG